MSFNYNIKMRGTFILLAHWLRVITVVMNTIGGAKGGSRIKNTYTINVASLT